MRRDSTQTTNFRKAEEWKYDMSSSGVEVVKDASGKRRIDSLSGHERNHLFLNQNGSDFSDCSLLSGADSIADGRAFAYLDFDRDGWQDIAVVNANSPLVNMYRNQFGDNDTAKSNQFVALRFVGGQTKDLNSNQYSCRDGFGTKVFARAGQLNLVREHRCGEGFCAQNSATMVIGIGKQESVDQLTLKWPSGKTSVIENVPSGSLLTCYENANHASSPHTNGFVIEDYYTSKPEKKPVVEKAQHLAIQLPTEKSKLKVFTSMATWCPSCKEHLPQFESLTNHFSSSEARFFGFPVDSGDDHTKLQEYLAANKPEYSLLLDAKDDDRSAFALALEANRVPANLPTSVITDNDLKIISVSAGVPTVSELAKLLEYLENGRSREPGP